MNAAAAMLPSKAARAWMTRMSCSLPHAERRLRPQSEPVILKVETAFNLRKRERPVGGARMDAGAAKEAQPSPASDGKAPRTARGERTLRKILDAARDEFGEQGFNDSSIVGITQRAGVALGTFYTYFDSKEALFQALVRDMSALLRATAAPAFTGSAHALDAARMGLQFFLQFARDH